MRRLLIAVAALALGLAVTPRPAGANGRFPRSVKIIFQPGQPATAAMGMTFGLLVTRDAGATWRWVCEAAVGFEGTFDPDYELSSSGALFATTPHGLRVDRDGCAWVAPTGDVGTTQVTSLAIGSDGAVWTGTSDPVTGSRIYRSTDDGVTFTPAGLDGQAGDWWSSIEVAPGQPDHVLVTAYRLAGGLPRERLMFRTVDGGAHWDALPTTGFATRTSSDLLIAALDPTNPDVAYMRVTAIGPTIEEAVYRTADLWTAPAATGPTWTKVLDVQDYITGLVVHAGGEVLATTPALGLHRSTDGGLTFAPVPGVQFDEQCLAERPGGELWMCTNNVPPDNATLHVSAGPAAGPWTPRLTFAQITGPVRCAAGTVQHDQCEATLWCGLVDNFNITSTEIACGGPVDAAVDAPAGDGGGKSCCSTGRGPGLEVGVVALGLLARRRRQRGRVSR